MAHGLIQVSGFLIESYHSVFNRNSNVLLKRTNRMVKRNIKKISVQTGILQSLLSDESLSVKVSGTLTIILPTSPREKHRRPTLVLHEFWSLPHTREVLGTYTSAINLPGSNPQGLVRNYLINISNKGIKQTTR